MPCFARVSGVMVKCSDITDCGELVQNGAYCYYLLVVKLVVKRGWVTTKVFLIHFFISIIFSIISLSCLLFIFSCGPSYSNIESSATNAPGIV